jgi:hypothetical protein
MKSVILVVGVLGLMVVGCERREAKVPPATRPPGGMTPSIPTEIEMTAGVEKAKKEEVSLITQPGELHVDDFRPNKVIGRMGIKLGVVVKVKGVVISGDELRYKAASGRYFFRVTEIEGKTLGTPVVMAFSKEMWDSAPMADNAHNLYWVKKGKAPDAGVSSKEREELQAGYLGKEFQLIVYETGKFSGVVENPYGEPIEVAHSGFGFESYMVVMGEWK